jgi:hypothetical protein
VRSESFPCIVCGTRLLRDMDEYEAQPREGVMCSTSGNYGSTVFDPVMSGDVAHFNVCDLCFEEAGEKGRVYVTQECLPVRTGSPIVIGGEFNVLLSVVGYKEIERPFVPWRRHLPSSEEYETLEIDEILERIDRNDNRYRWNLDREAFEYMKRELETNT